MDKRTVIAVIISALVIIVGFSIQNVITGSRAAQQEAGESPGEELEEIESPQATSPASDPSALQAVEDPLVQCNLSYENSTLRAAFDPDGATMHSFELLEHTATDNQPVEMIFRGQTDQTPFSIVIGENNDIILDGPYSCRNLADGIEFYKRYTLPEIQSEPFTVRKIFRFFPGEYLFELEVIFENSINKQLPLVAERGAYRLYVGPQIGPEFRRLDNRQEYRNYHQYVNGRRRRIRLRGGRQHTVADSAADWVAVEGKYFALITIPHSGVSAITLSNAPREGIVAVSELYIDRLSIKSSVEHDSYLFYLGPKIRRELARYDSADENQRGLSSLNIKRVIPTRPLIGWLESILKLGLQVIYRVVPNYGIAIILLTILVKLLLTPLTKRSQKSMLRMQELSPKVAEIRERHQGNQQKINVELATLYKREGVNPAGGCLPLLLQFPFFIAMFGIFNNHFELRGATFIAGWINDLSQPESIWNFGEFTIPILGWNDLRLLPLLFVATQVLSGVIIKNPAQSQQQARMFAIIMPLVFFFLLYNMPSGLLLYWIVTNLLTVVQQAGTVMAQKRST